MIWKESDLADVAINKRAIQSSISKWSCYDDASRALHQAMYDDYAFHTGFEENPWWMVDLEQEVEIDIIKITNRTDPKFQYRLKSIKVELSLDNIFYTRVDNSCFEWQDGLKALEVNIYKSTKARYVKISLQEKNFLHFLKCQIYIRKIPGYIIAMNPDGFGMRLYAILCALILAEKTGFKFRFKWDNSTDMEYIGVDGKQIHKDYILLNMDSVERFFSKDFINKYYLDNYNPTNKYHSKITTIKSFKEFSYKTPEYKYGWHSTTYFPSRYITEYSDDECFKDAGRMFKHIEWSQEFKEIINYINSQVVDEFTAIHLRGGELIFSDIKLQAQLWYYSRHFPYEIGLDFILKHNCNVIIFGQDILGNKKLAEYVNTIKKGDMWCKTCDDFFDKEYFSVARDFFELVLMSKAQSIITTNKSAFAITASLISGKNIFKSYMDFYTDFEMYEIIKKYIFTLDLNNLQIAFSYFRLYELAKILKLPQEAKIHIVNAIAYDNSNFLWHILLIDILLALNEYEEAEKATKEALSLNAQEFFRALFVGRCYPWSGGIYWKIDSKFLNFSLKALYPHISFVAAKIAFYRKNYLQCYQFLQFSLKYKANDSCITKLSLELKDMLDELQIKSNGAIPPLPTPKIQQGSAKHRIHSHLAYKLGQAMILNSKSLLGYIRMPYVLSYIKESHKKEISEYEARVAKNPQLKLPKLESYPDYKEALKEKQCFTYRLGEALMQADKDWYKGGYLRFCFKELPRLKREFREKRR